jgi:HSP20 family protein
MSEEPRKDVSVERERSGGLMASAREPFVHLREEMDRLFDEIASGWPIGRSRRRRSGMGPYGDVMSPFRTMSSGWGAEIADVDVIDKKKEVQVRAELPGMNEDDIDVRVSDGVLTIRGEKKEERREGEEDGDYYLSERRYGSFQRSFSLPDGLDLDKVDASFKKGILTVTLPKNEEAQRKIQKIEIKSEK